MIPFWEGEIKQFKEAMKGLLDFDQHEWPDDWFEGDWNPGFGQMSLDKAIEQHDRNYKPQGPFPFIPKLMLTLTDLRKFDPMTLDTKRVLTCRGLSRSGYSGQITIWYDKVEFAIAEALHKATIRIAPLLSSIYTDKYDPSRVGSVARSLGFLHREEEGIDFTLPQVQDFIYPYYIRAQVTIPFEYHRKGVLMVFSMNELPAAGSIGKYRSSKTVQSFSLAGDGLGLWFDDPALASYFRLKYTVGVKETGKNRMVIGTSYD